METGYPGKKTKTSSDIEVVPALYPRSRPRPHVANPRSHRLARVIGDPLGTAVLNLRTHLAHSPQRWTLPAANTGKAAPHTHVAQLASNAREKRPFPSQSITRVATCPRSPISAGRLDGVACISPEPTRPPERALHADQQQALGSSSYSNSLGTATRGTRVPPDTHRMFTALPTCQASPAADRSPSRPSLALRDHRWLR